MLFIALAVYGVLSYTKLGRSENPNVTFPVVVISAGYPGASPQEMERLVIKPIEDQLDGIQNLDRMSAVAQDGRAVVVVQFLLDTKLDFAAIDVQRRVDTARIYMPTDLDPPYVDKSAGDQQSPILELALASKSLSGTELSDLVDQRILPELKHIPDVQSVGSRGQVKREFHVSPDPQRMMATSATLPDIFGAISANNANLPGGRLDGPAAETDVSIRSDIVRATDMLGIPLAVPGGAQKALSIGNIASVDDGHVDQRVVSKYNGAPTVILDLNRVITADEIHSTAVARAMVKTIAARYPQVTFTEIEAPADYTQKSLNGVRDSLLEGIVLTAIVLMFFLHAWRNAVVVMIAIPSSLLATLIVMQMLHFTLDIVSLMGLSLIIGILVDDSIVVLENITRHRDMGERPLDAAIKGRSEIGSAAVAITLVDVVVFLPIAFLSGIVGKFMVEFGIVVVVATLFSLLVSFTLTPMLAARWSVKKRSAAPPKVLAWFQVAFDRFNLWYRDVAFSYIIRHRWMVVFVCLLLLINAVMLPASAFTVAIGIDVFAIAIAVVWMLFGPLLYALGNRAGGDARRVFRWALGGAGAAAVIAVASIVVGMAGTPVFMKVAGLAGVLVAFGLSVAFFASLMVRRPAVSRRASISIVGIVGGIAGVMLLLMIGGKGIETEFIPNSDTGSIRMTLSFPTGTPLKTTQATVDRLEEAIVKVDGIEKVITTTGVKPSGFGSTVGGNVARMYAEMDKNRRKETNRAVRDIRKLSAIAPGALFTVAGEGGGGGGGDPINYTLSGPEDVIDAAANKLAAYVRSIPGTVNVQTGAELAATRLDVLIDRAKCAALGVNPGSAGTAARIGIGGAVATRVRTVTGLVDVRVQLPARYRSRIEQVRNIAIRANDGSMYHLGDVASFSYVKAPTKIERLDKQRVAHVSGGIDPGVTTLGPVVNKLNAATSTPGFFPNGVALRASGDSQFLSETISSMSIALLTSFALVYVLMVILYGSFFTPAVIMLSVPVALVGALFMLAATHQSLNLFSMIGIIMLFGLVAKNGILLVDYANTMRKRGMRAVDAMRAAAGTRLRPIVMTTAAMVFGMLPLSLGLAEGAEFRRSMGTVLIGGLLSSLILTLFLVPVVYSWVVTWLEMRADKRALHHEHEDDEFSPPAQPRVTAGAMGD
ncbi:MAG: efflux RND transporter permease subunit [Candidatus Eremiobacteraeota bacterium]|nr:efflux RND transporter permease subunit [Candidatus Eremiobacteraeota bacterium]